MPLYRGEALRAWEAGVDGIYTYNLNSTDDPLLRQLGDPKILQNLPHHKQESFAAPGNTHFHNPGFWLKGGRQYLKGSHPDYCS